MPDDFQCKIREKKKLDKLSGKKKLKKQIICDRSCLRQTERIIRYCVCKYGSPKYYYGNVKNIRPGLTIHHIIPRCCGGGNEPSNLVYVPKSIHDMIHDIMCEDLCSAEHEVLTYDKS